MTSGIGSRIGGYISQGAEKVTQTLDAISGNSHVRRGAVGVTLVAISSFTLLAMAHVPYLSMGLHGVHLSDSFSQQIIYDAAPLGAIVAAPGVILFIGSKYYLHKKGHISDETYERIKTFATLTGAVATFIIATPILQKINYEMTESVNSTGNIFGSIMGAIGTVSTMGSGLPQFGDPKELMGIFNYSYLIFFATSTLGSKMITQAYEGARGEKSENLRSAISLINNLMFLYAFNVGISGPLKPFGVFTGPELPMEATQLAERVIMDRPKGEI